MSFDDRLRDALDGAAPEPPDAAAARAGLAPAMTRARRQHRARRAVGVGSLALALLVGTAVAAVQLSNPDDQIETVIEPSVAGPQTAVTTTTGAPGLVTTTTITSQETPKPTMTVAESWGPSKPTTTVATPPHSPSSTSPNSTTNPVAEVPRLHGPHATVCGTVTFAYTQTMVTVKAHTSVAGYRFQTEGEGSREVKARWDEGPGQECEIAAHLENGVLSIEVDKNETP